jgi:hypothetical protein
MPIPPEDKKALSDFSNYKKTTVATMNEEIKRLTGAQMSESEAKRLMGGMPNPGTGFFDGDSPTEFEGALKATYKNLSKTKARLMWYRAKGLGDEQIKLMVESAKYPAMLDDMPCELPIINSVQIEPIALPLDYLQISKRQQAIAPSSTIDVHSEPVDDSQELFLIGALSGLSQQKGWLTASNVKQFSRQFKDIPPDQIREMFVYMAQKGIGQTQKSGTSLEWKV